MQIYIKKDNNKKINATVLNIFTTSQRQKSRFQTNVCFNHIYSYVYI